MERKPLKLFIINELKKNNKTILKSVFARKIYQTKILIDESKYLPVQRRLVNSFYAIRYLMRFTAMNDITDSTSGMAEFKAMPRPLFSNLP